MKLRSLGFLLILGLWLTTHNLVQAANTDLPYVQRFSFSHDYDEAEINLNKRQENARLLFEYFDAETNKLGDINFSADTNQIRLDDMDDELKRHLNFGDEFYIRITVCPNEMDLNMITRQCGIPFTQKRTFAGFNNFPNKLQSQIAPQIFVTNATPSLNFEQISVDLSRPASGTLLVYELRDENGFNVIQQRKVGISSSSVMMEETNKVLDENNLSGTFHFTLAICPSNAETLHPNCSHFYKDSISYGDLAPIEIIETEEEVTEDINNTLEPSVFTDTDPNTLEGQAAAYLHTNNILKGYDDGSFGGLRNVTRAEAAKILLLSRFENVRERRNNNRFSDVGDGLWFTKYIVMASDLGIINGHPDGTFRPGYNVNTVEFLKMLAGTFNLEVESQEVRPWYAAYLPLADQYELFPSFRTTPSPGYKLTRKDLAIALYQYLSLER